MIQATNILVSKPDTLGDLVLLEPLLRLLRESRPGAQVRVLVRDAYLPLVPLLDGGVEWLGIAANPFSTGPEQAWDQVEALLRVLRDNPPELIIAPHRHRCWLTDLLLASFPEARSVGLGADQEDPFFGEQLRRKLGLTVTPAFTERPALPPDLPEWRNAALVAQALGTDIASLRPPTLTIPDELQDEARRLLAGLGLEPGSFAVCAAAGHANVPIKSWPAAHFAACARWLHAEHHLPCLLVGSHDEAPYLKALAAEAGPDCVRVWTGGADDLPLLAALCGAGRIFLGNDTGAMHLAAALQVPVCAIFGGGTWPRFVPAASRFAALVSPMPCFGCGWDCCLADAPCVRSVQVEDTIGALRVLLSGGSPGIIQLSRLSAESLDFARKSSEGHRRLAALLSRRQAEFERTVQLAGEKDSEITGLKRAADEKDLEIGRIKEAALGKDTEIQSLKAAATEKDGEIANLKAAALGKDREIGNLKQASLGQDTEITSLKQACDERLALINRLSDEIHSLQAEASRLGTLCKEHQQAAEAAAALAEKTEQFYRALAPDAGAWAAQLNEARTEAARLGGELGARDAEVAALRQRVQGLETSLANVTAGLGSLELHRFHQRQLREKEDMIQLLHRSCVEREALIRRLSLGESAPARILAGLGGWWEARVTAPFRDGWERRVQDGHWMRLGELRQHEPRALRWDSRVRRVALPQQAPVIGIVTPSYNQATFLGSTLTSVLAQEYPKLLYVVQDGGSTDASPRLIAEQAAHLHAWESARDGGQADAIRRGFDRILPKLGPDDLMAWLNSDDLLAPRALGLVADYFARNPGVDAVYGHRIIIDGHDREIGRWILPPHRSGDLLWADFIPQETLFWRRRAWDRVGGLDPSLHFALDWDFLLRLEQAGAVIHRLPFFLGAFRVHEESKTHSQISKRGREEMDLLLKRTHGSIPDHATIDRQVTHMRARAALCSRLLSLGLRT